MPLKRVEKTTTAPAESDAPGSDYLDDLMPLIEKGTVIPIISSSIRIEHIFGDEETLTNRFSDKAELAEGTETTNEELTKVWAEKIKYPMADNHNLARVAQFFQVGQDDLITAKIKYLKFLTDYLLDITAEDENYRDAANQMKKINASFSKIANDLDYPRFPPDLKDQDPLRILARLPLKKYVTTSPYTFMEQALLSAGRHPRTEVCFWTGKNKAQPESPVVTIQTVADKNKLPDDDKQKTEEPPVVYHLFGLEDEPQTLVLSEDDYMKFLISVVEDTNTDKPIVPLWLREGLAESRLLLLGYRIQDWDFRVLFRLISNRRNDTTPRGMLIQLQQGLQLAADKEESIKYLSSYFNKNQFDVDWTNPEKFLRKLWGEWEKYINP